MKRDPNSLIAVIAVLLVGILCQSSGAESPALAYMSEEFSDIPFSTITLVTTIPSLMMIPASLAYSAIRRKVSVRPLFIIAMFLLIGGGVYPAFSSTFAQVCIGRAVFGIGCGIMWPLAQSIIVELYDGTKQNTLLGFNSVITAVGGIIWANLGGVLALSGWRHSFFTYLVPVGIFIFCAAFLPKIGKSETIAADDNGEEKKNFVGAAIILMFAYFMFNFCNMTYFTNLSMKVVGENMGSSASSGLAQSFFTIGSLIIGLLFGLAMRSKTFAKFAMGLGWILTGLGMVIVGISESFTLVCLGSVIQGFGTGMFMPCMVGLIGNLGGKRNAATILGISTCILGASQFFGPTIFNKIVEAIGAAAGGPCITLAAYVHIACAIITLIVLTIKKNPSSKTAIVNSI